MVEFNNVFRLLRIVVFGTASLFALIVIVLGGLVTNFTDTFADVFFNSVVLGIATGLLTVLTLPTMLVLSMIRKGAFTSMIAVEIGWIWFLWIMWLAVGGSSVNIFFSCGDYLRAVTRTACVETSAITAFGFLSWILLMSYNITLSTLTFRQHFRGYTEVWIKDVTATDFTATGVNNTQTFFDPKATYAPQSQYPQSQYPQSQYPQYPPVGTPVPIPHQQTAGSYISPAASPVGSPYSQPQAPSLYVQPQSNGSFTHPSPQPQTPSGTNPYPQI